MTTYTPTLDDKLLDRLRGAVRGEIVEPGDPDYDEARKVYNAMHDRRPAIIVRAVDAGGVIATVDFARDQGLTLAVRGGSHSVNFMDGDDQGRVRTNYRANYTRLTELKRRYDPGNLFHLNHNIAP
jgi:FAD/FMN-containing dehydrogenase